MGRRRVLPRRHGHHLRHRPAHLPRSHRRVRQRRQLRGHDRRGAGPGVVQQRGYRHTRRRAGSAPRLRRRLGTPRVLGGDHLASRRVDADVQRRHAQHEGRVLRPQHARPGLGGHHRDVPTPRLPRQHQERPSRRPPAGARRALRAARVCVHPIGRAHAARG